MKNKRRASLLAKTHQISLRRTNYTHASERRAHLEVYINPRAAASRRRVVQCLPGRVHCRWVPDCNRGDNLLTLSIEEVRLLRASLVRAWVCWSANVFTSEWEYSAVNWFSMFFFLFSESSCFFKNCDGCWIFRRGGDASDEKYGREKKSQSKRRARSISKLLLPTLRNCDLVILKKNRGHGAAILMRVLGESSLLRWSMTISNRRVSFSSISLPSD